MLGRAAGLERGVCDESGDLHVDHARGDLMGDMDEDEFDHIGCTEHVLLFGLIEVNGECIVSITCKKCDLLATGTGIVSDLGGGYAVIESHERQVR
jgi:hypothetical protein